jgi:hypothetical protein
MLNFTALNNMMDDYDRTLGIERRLRNLIKAKQEQLTEMCDDWDRLPESLRHRDEDQKQWQLGKIIDRTRELEILQEVLDG